jgi:hypothetical protein
MLNIFYSHIFLCPNLAKLSMDNRHFSYITKLEKKKPLILEFSLKSSCLHLIFGSFFTPYPLFQWGLQSKEVLLNLGSKCWNSTFSATRAPTRWMPPTHKVGKLCGITWNKNTGWLFSTHGFTIVRFGWGLSKDWGGALANHQLPNQKFADRHQLFYIM